MKLVRALGIRPMQENSSKFQRKLKRFYIAIGRNLMGLLQSFREVFDLVLSAIGLKRRIPRRRNKDFERAGREVPHIDAADTGSLRNLDKAGKTREQEVIRQVRYERKTLRRRNQEAQQLRETMQEDNKSVSQGDALSHLARMNQRQRKKEATTPKNNQQES